MVDRFGLLTDGMPNLLRSRPNWCEARALKNWDTDNDVLSLLDVVRNVKPDILIGVSGQTGLFTEKIIREMHKHCERPYRDAAIEPDLTRGGDARISSHGPKAMRWSRPAVRSIRWCGRTPSTHCAVQ